MVSTFMGRNWASIQHRKQAKGTSQHICVKTILMLPLNMSYILKLKANKTHDFKTLELIHRSTLGKHFDFPNEPDKGSPMFLQKFTFVHKKHSPSQGHHHHHHT
jgi:hypothetical protein